MDTKQFKKLNTIAEKGLNSAFVIEKKTGMPSYFTVPHVKIIKLNKHGIKI